MSDTAKISRRGMLASFICAAAGVVALGAYLGWAVDMTERFLLVIGVAVLGVLGAAFFARLKPRVRLYGTIVGLGFALAQVGSARLNAVGTLAREGAELMLLAACALCFTPAVGGAFAWLARAVEARRGGAASTATRNADSAASSSRIPAASSSSAALLARLSPRLCVTLGAAIILLCWLPVFLAFYPGLFTYDVSYQYLQYTTGELNTHHPLLHTLMVGGFLDLGRLIFGYPVKGIALYTLFQMAVMALSMSHSVSFLLRRGAPKWLCALTLGIYALAPFCSLLAISTTKDTLFAGAVLHLSVLTCALVLEPGECKGWRWGARYALTAAAVCLTRNNGFVCLAALIVAGAALITMKRGYGKRLAALSLIGLALFGASSATLKLITGAKSGSLGEALSLPAQQLARVYATADDEEKPEIKRYMPDADAYIWSIADSVKNTLDPKASELPAFLGLWARVGLRHPVAYMDAFGLLMGDLFDLDGALDTRGAYLETDFHKDEGEWLEESSKLPWLKDLYTRLYGQNGYKRVPLLSSVLAHAFWCWLMLIAAALAACLRARAALVPALAVLALFLSVLMGPCVMLRYIYPIILCAPFLWGALLMPERAQPANP